MYFTCKRGSEPEQIVIVASTAGQIFLISSSSPTGSDCNPGCFIIALGKVPNLAGEL